MGKDLRRRIKKNSEDFYKLYQAGRKINIGNNLLVFLLLSAIEEISKYLIEILLDKCDDPKLRRNIRSRIYKDHLIKYQFFLALYYVMTPSSVNDIATIIEKIKAQSLTWLKLRNTYLVNVSNVNVRVSPEELNEVEVVYLQYEQIEDEIKKLDRENSCGLLNTLVNMLK